MINVNEKFIEELEKMGNIKECKKDEVIFFEGDESENIYILLEGLVSLEKIRFDGKEIIVDYLMPISFVAGYCNFLDIPFQVTSKFVTNGKLIEINYREFKKIFMASIENLVDMIKIMSEGIRYVYSYQEEKSLKNAKIKIARFLIGHGELYSLLNKNKIASILGLTPETFSRTIKEFKELGIIKNKRIDKQKLITLMKEEIDISQ